MRRLFNLIPPKARLFITVLMTVLVPVLFITFFGVYRSKINAEENIKQNLALQTQIIKKMFEREHRLKLSKVHNDLKVFHDRFYQYAFSIPDDSIKIEVLNQFDEQVHETYIKNWQLNGNSLYGNDNLVMSIQNMLGGTQTIFQKIDSGYVRISTNVKKEDGSFATGTYIPNSSDVVRTIENGENYYGRAYVVNDWYITAYEPFYFDNKLVGMIYTGDKEKDIPELKDKLESLQFGKTGNLMILNSFQKRIIGSDSVLNQGEYDYLLTRTRSAEKDIFFFPEEISTGSKLAVIDYFPDFNLHIIITVSLREEARKTTRELVFNSSLLAFIIVLFFSILVYFLNSENVRHFYLQLERSNKKLDHVERKLDETKRDFRTLFDSNSDDVFVTDEHGRIVELNQMACDSFRKKRAELVGQNITGILSENRRQELIKKLDTAFHFGKVTFESEYQYPEGDTLPVEMKTKVIEYKGRKLLLTTVRDIKERKEIEEKILTTIIQTEENERKRFSADLHDDLGPILSTVKLYTSLLTKNDRKGVSNEENIKTIGELIDNSIQTTRAISRNIRPSILQDFGLAAAIEEFCSYIKKTKAITINLSTHNYKIKKRGIEETILYHTAKELINNTLRYADAKNIKMDLKSFENQIIFYYRDDGIGFDMELMKQVPKGLGLNNIVNKIRSIKGSVDLHSEPGKGMFLIASVKINPDQ